MLNSPSGSEGSLGRSTSNPRRGKALLGLCLFEIVTMRQVSDGSVPRRDFLRLSAATVAFGPFFLFPDRALATQKTLKIAKWAHFLPEYDAWFETVLAREWSKQHDTRVIVDHIAVDKVHDLAAKEVANGNGHDLFMFPWPPAEYKQHVI